MQYKSVILNLYDVDVCDVDSVRQLEMKLEKFKEKGIPFKIVLPSKSEERDKFKTTRWFHTDVVIKKHEVVDHFIEFHRKRNPDEYIKRDRENNKFFDI